MKKVVIFGVGENALLLRYYLERDSKYKFEYKVVAFTLDREYIREQVIDNLPVIPFDEIEKYFIPRETYMFIALGYSKMNTLREKKFIEAQNKGYKFFNYISSKAICNAEKIGINNFIFEGAIIHPFVEIGNNNVIMCGGIVSHDTKVGNNCYIAGGAAISGKCVVEDNCFFGTNSTVRDNLKIKYKTLVGAAAWISINTEEYDTYIASNGIKVKKKSIDIKI